MTFNHLEYDAGSLDVEYRRGRYSGHQIGMPANCYPASDPDRLPLNG